MSIRNRALALALAVVLVVSGIAAGAVFLMKRAGDDRVISRVAKTPDGKGYLEVDGKPFLFGYVENWGVQQIMGDTGGFRFNTKPFDEPLPFAWMENVFEKTQALGYRTIAPFLRWNDIEPSVQGEYDWTVLDQYVKWAETYDLRIDIVWMGSIHCGGARLRGENNGWMSWIPDYLQDKARYFGKGIFDTDIFLAYVPDGGPNDADARYLHQCERDAVAAMMAHLSEVDTTHRVITFQVNNEPNFSPYWRENKPAILAVLNELGKVVKTSDYSVMTRINLTGSQLDPDLNALEYIDCNGVDPYSYSVADVARIGADREGSHMPHIAENGAYYGNTTSLMVATLAAGGFYATYHINDHFGKFGFYDGDAVPYRDWKLGEIPPKRHSGFDVRNLNLSLQKIEALVATSPADSMTGLNIATDMPVAVYDDFVHFSGHDIGLHCEDGSVGLVVREGESLYFVSDTSLQVSLLTRVRPLAAEVGAFGADGKWVAERDVEAIEGEDGLFRSPCRSQEVLRVRLPEPQELPPPSLLEDGFDDGLAAWTKKSGTWTRTEGPDPTLVQSNPAGEARILAGDGSWSDLRVVATLAISEGTGGIAGRLDDKGDGYYFGIDEASYTLWKRVKGQQVSLASGPLPPARYPDGRRRLEMVLEGDHILLFIDDVSLGESLADPDFLSGRIGLWTDRATLEAFHVRAAGVPLFRDGFAGGLVQWSKADGDWTVGEDDGVLRQSDNRVEASLYAGDAGWKDYSVSVDFQMLGGYGGLIGRMDSRGDFYMLEIRARSIRLVKWMDETWTPLSVHDVPFVKGSWYTVSLSFRGSRIDMRLDGVPIGEPVYDASIEEGRIGLRTSFGVMAFDNVVVD